LIWFPFSSKIKASQRGAFIFDRPEAGKAAGNPLEGIKSVKYLAEPTITTTFAPDKMMCGEAKGLFFVVIQLLITEQVFYLYD